jgi:fatty-acyl-CoA synthase
MFSSCYGLSVSQLLGKAASSRPDKEVIYDNGVRLTYKELENESNELARGLSQLGIKKGDRVAVCLPNWHEFVVVYFAVARVGAILIPFNTRYRNDEVEYILSNSGARAAFFTREFGHVNHYEQFENAKSRVSSLEYLITVRFEENGLLSYRQLLEQGRNQEPPSTEIDPKEDVFSILYTSGTTGKPKGAMLTHDNVVHTGTISAEHMRCTPDDVFLVPVPLFHVFGMVPSLLSAVASESKMVLMDAFKAEKALALVEQERVTVHHGVPTMFILELNHPQFQSYDLSSLRTGIIAAAPCPVETVRRIRSDMGCDICVCYGLTETSPTLTATDFEDDDIVRSETVGKVLPGAEVKVVNDQHEELPAGEVGELACRGFGIMKGYFHMPEKTREAIDEKGWFYTGDMASIDDQGYVRIVGRKKEMIVRGGYNIYPREVEEVFYSHPAIMEVAIVGLPDTVLGEIAFACIRLKPEKEVSEKDLKNFVNDKVADFKVPDKILLMQEFPMTASGKIKKVALQDQLKNELKKELR